MIVRAAIMRNVAFVISAVLSFLMVPLIINLLGDHWYGIWVIVAAFMGYYGLLDLGITSATQRFLALALARNEERESHEIIGTSFILFTAVGGASFLITGTLIYAVPYLAGPETDTAVLRILLVLMGIDIALSFPLSVFRAILNARMRVDIIAAIDTGKAIFRFAGMLYVIQTQGTIIGLAVASLVVNQAANIVFIWIARREIPGRRLFPRHFSRHRAKSLFSFGKYTFLTSVGDLLRFRVDVAVIGYILGAAAVTPYNIALRLHEVAAQSVANVVTGFQPLFVNHYAKGDTATVRERMLTMTRIGLCLSTLASAAVILIARPLIEVWVGTQYFGALLPLFILRVIAPLGVAQNPGIQVLYTYERHRFYAYITITEAFFNLALSIILIRHMGLAGVALGTAIPYLISKIFALPIVVCNTIQLKKIKYYKILFGYISSLYVMQFPIWYYLKITGWERTIWLSLPSVAVYEFVLGFMVLYVVIPDSDYDAIKKVVRFLPQRRTARPIFPGAKNE